MNEATMDEKMRELLGAAKATCPEAYEGEGCDRLALAVKAFEDDETATILRGIRTAIKEDRLLAFFFDFTDIPAAKVATQEAIDAWFEKHSKGDDDE